MTPGETTRTVVALLQMDLAGELTQERFAQLLDDETTLETMTSMLGVAIGVFTALAERDAEQARDVLEQHRAVSFLMDE
jgi:hypothetical protein